MTTLITAAKETRLVQDDSDHSSSKEPKNPLCRRGFFSYDPSYHGLICLVKKHKIRFWILESWILFKKRTLSSPLPFIKYNPVVSK